MRKADYAIIDVSSIAKACYFAGQDKEFGFDVIFEERKVLINGWQHGRENFINYMGMALRECDLVPMNLIFVLEGSDGTKIRRNIYPGYKNRKPRAPEAMEQYNIFEAWIQEYFSRLGSVFVKVDGLEADDVVKYLAENLKGRRRVVMMNDGDGVILDNGDDVRVRYLSELVKQGENPVIKHGVPVELNRVYKAICGDASDTLPGAKGVREVGFDDLCGALGFEGVLELERVIKDADWDSISGDVSVLAASEDPIDRKAAKVIEKILESKDVVRRCWHCVGFFDYLVGTPDYPLQWMPGMALEKPVGDHAEPRFDGFYQRRKLVSAGNFADVMASNVWSLIKGGEYVSFDLETSSADESDDWLREVNRQNPDDEPKGVDWMGSNVAGFGLTFGSNQQYTYYFTVDHKTDKNITREQMVKFLTRMLQEAPEMRITVHNSSFELPVMFNEVSDLTADLPEWKHGFLPRVMDSLFLASYVNENIGKGLKSQAKEVLGYEQQTYEEVTQGRKMRELTPQEVFDYGTDDTVVTSALRNYYEIVMRLEGTWELADEVETRAAYLVACGMLQGVEFDREEMRRQERADDLVYEENWKIVREYLIEKKWEGVEPITPTLEAASIKEIFLAVAGSKIESKARKPEVLIAAMRDMDDPVGNLLANAYEHALANDGDMSQVMKLVMRVHKGEPELNFGSPKQLATLFYDEQFLNIPQRVYGNATDSMREEGRKKGNLSTNALAIASAKYYDSETHPREVEILMAIHKMRAVQTRRGLYYKPYSTLRHWKTGRIHPSFGQSMAGTRRFTPNGPNLAQLPSDPEKGAFRRTILPHHPDAVFVSCDFKAQELVLIADGSQDQAMLSCYVGDNRRDMHHLTGLSIYQRTTDSQFTYQQFAEAIEQEYAPVKKSRKNGKTTNFATEFGAMAPKLAETLMVPVDIAQTFLDAKLETFWRAEEWKKQELIPLYKKQGYAETLLGARRHLPGFKSAIWFERSKAERQGVNFRIQGSAAEQTKLAMGRIWDAELLIRYDAAFAMTVHDEILMSVHKDEALAFIPELHACMVAKYATMSINTESSIGIGRNFYDLIEIGSQPDPAKIQGAIDKLFSKEKANA